MTRLICVHGFMGGSDQWRQQAPLAHERGMVCLDLPGFGKNAHLPPVDSIAGFSSWALDALSQRGIDRFDLMGHSMGGMIVQNMVRQAPHRINNLILYATGSRGLLPGRFETIETSMARAKADGPEATARRIAATWFLHREMADGYAHCAEIATQSTLPAILGGLKAMRDWSGEAYLQSIAANTLIIWGDRDRTYAWPQIETLWSQIPDASLAVIPNAAHAVHAERADLFNQVVSGFLSDGDMHKER